MDFIWTRCPCSRVHNRLHSDVFWSLEWFSNFFIPWTIFIWLFRWCALSVPLLKKKKKIKTTCWNTKISPSFAKITTETYHSSISSAVVPNLFLPLHCSYRRHIPVSNTTITQQFRQNGGRGYDALPPSLPALSTENHWNHLAPYRKTTININARNPPVNYLLVTYK